MQPISSELYRSQNDFLVMVLVQRHFWAISGGGDPADGFVVERLALGLRVLSQQKTPGPPELPFSQHACATSVLLPPGAVAIAFPCSWTQSYCSTESWQLPEKAEQALWPLSEGLRCFTSRSAADSPREVIFFPINGCVPLSTA